MFSFVWNFLYSFGPTMSAIIRRWWISGCITIWVLFCFWFCLGAWQIASHLFLPIPCTFIPKIFESRREVLALPNRITSKISAPFFGARAKLALLHWVAAMGFPVALLAILSLRSPHHCTFAARSLRRLLFTCHCFSDSSPDGMSPIGHNHLLSCNVKGHKSGLQFWN